MVTDIRLIADVASDMCSLIELLWNLVTLTAIEVGPSFEERGPGGGSSIEPVFLLSSGSGRAVQGVCAGAYHTRPLVQAASWPDLCLLDWAPRDGRSSWTAV